MRKIACIALLLALGGCQDANEDRALNSCRIARLEKAPTSVEGAYFWPCMALKGYRFKYEDRMCGPGPAYNISSCYEPDGELAKLRKTIFGS